MKTNKGLRTKEESFGSSDSLRKAAKLQPIKKSGKDRVSKFLEEEDDDIIIVKKKFSTLDYFADGDEDIDDLTEEDDFESYDEDSADWDDEEYEEEEYEEEIEN